MFLRSIAQEVEMLVIILTIGLSRMPDPLIRIVIPPHLTDHIDDAGHFAAVPIRLERSLSDERTPSST